MLYIIQNVYKPNEATINRLLAFIRSFDKAGVNATVVFIMPDKDKSVIDEVYQNISVKYLWNSQTPNNKYTKYLFGFWYAYKFARKLKDGDKVMMFDVCFWDVFMRRKGIEYYYEVTECPEVITFPTMPFDTSRKRYLSYCRKMSGIMVISTELKRYFRERGLDGNKIHIINMVVDAKRFEGVFRPASEKYIAYCGTASNNKDGVDQLIKAFGIFHKKFTDYKLYIIGNTPSRQQANNNYELTEQLGLKDYVVFTGVVPAKKMPEMLSGAQILALDRPDNIQAKYGFPTKLGEYLLTGKPVVVTKVGDIPSFLSDKVSALLASPNNPEDFAAKLAWVCEHPQEAGKIGENGKKVALEHFNSDIEAMKLRNIILGSNS